MLLISFVLHRNDCISKISIFWCWVKVMVQVLRITPRKYLKLCWTVFQHLVELSVPYTLWYAIFKNDCADVFSLISSCCYSHCIRCLPGDNFLYLWKLFVFLDDCLQPVEDSDLILISLTDSYRNLYLLGEGKTRFLLQVHKGSKGTGIYSSIQNLLVLLSFLVLVWKNFLAI